MRLPRVVAGASLTVALALVVVPGSVGSRTPTADLALDPALLQPVMAPAAARTTTATPTLDAAHRSDGALRDGDRLVDPAGSFDAPTRPAVANPPAPVEFVPIATPRPTPRPPTPRAAPTPPSGGSGSSGTWRSDPEVSWYGPGLYGNRTACGQTLTTSLMGVAHRTLPCGTKVSFRNPANGRVVTVPVVDRGPYAAGRQWDLTGGACLALNHCYTGPIQWRLP